MQPLPFVFPEIVDAAIPGGGGPVSFTLKALTNFADNAVAVLFRGIGCDRGIIAGGAGVDTCTIRLVPRGSTRAFGGNVYLPFYAFPGEDANGRVIKFNPGIVLPINEDIDVDVDGTAGETFRLWFDRVVLGPTEAAQHGIRV